RSASALDLSADHQGERKQDDADRKNRKRDTANSARGLQRDDPHQTDRRRQQGEIAADEMAALITDALRHRRGRGQAHDDAKSHQPAERDQIPAIDGPPPSRDRALVDAGETHRNRPLPGEDTGSRPLYPATSEYMLTFLPCLDTNSATVLGIARLN